MSKVISVRFRNNNRAYYFDPGENDIHAGEGVIVETSRGEEYGSVTEGVKEIAETEVVQPLKPVIRVATEEDERLRKEFMAKESEAFMVCQEKITAHKLDMKLVDVEYTYNGSKIVFYFTADERVDFRDLVKDLAYALRTRIELRQIGVRDEAKLLGGLGPCGRPVCCNAFLDDFRPVSIKMAKEQSLSLSPTKISGLCGRLMCCLAYEQNAYEEAHKRMPRVGKETETPEGTGVVVESNAITERVKVRLTQEDGTFVIKEFPAAETAAPGCPVKKQAEAEEKADKAETAEMPVSGESGEIIENKPADTTAEAKPERKKNDRRRSGRGNSEKKQAGKPADADKETPKENGAETAAENQKEESGEPKPERRRHHRGGRGRGGAKPASGNGGENGGQDASAGQEKKPRENGGRDNREKGPRQEDGGRRRDPKPRRESKPAEKAEQREITRLPGETIGGVTRLPGETIGGAKPANDGAAEKHAAPKQPYGRQHRRHSFGK